MVLKKWQCPKNENSAVWIAKAFELAAFSQSGEAAGIVPVARIQPFAAGESCF
jgi:hypothetical protein